MPLMASGFRFPSSPSFEVPSGYIERSGGASTRTEKLLPEVLENNTKLVVF